MEETAQTVIRSHISSLTLHRSERKPRRLCKRLAEKLQHDQTKIEGQAARTHHVRSRARQGSRAFGRFRESVSKSVKRSTSQSFPRFVVKVSLGALSSFLYGRTQHYASVGPQQLPISWSHVPAVAIVSYILLYTSKTPPSDIEKGYIEIHMYLYVHTYLCIYMYIYIYLCIHIHTHIYMYIHL